MSDEAPLWYVGGDWPSLSPRERIDILDARLAEYQRLRSASDGAMAAALLMLLAIPVVGVALLTLASLT